MKSMTISILFFAAVLLTACSNKEPTETAVDISAESSADISEESSVDILEEFSVEISEESAGTEDTSAISSGLSFSKDSGMYAEPFELTITALNGKTIYYTTDGSDPLASETRREYTTPLQVVDQTNSPNVLSAIDPTLLSLFYRKNDMKLPDKPVDKCSVIRAAAEGGRVDTKTYFVGIGPEYYNNVALLSLVTDSANFFDHEKGIYCLGKTLEDYKAEHPGTRIDSWSPSNYNQRGREWERPVHIDFFETDGSIALSQDCGVRIQGNYSRGDFPKSLRFYARSDYGDGGFSYDFLGALAGEKLELTTKETFILRTGANDSYYTKFKDSYLQSLVYDRDVETQAGRPCILFLDGEYWGLYTLQEDYTDNYFKEKYGVAKEEVVYYKNNELDEGEETDLALYTELIDFARNNDLTVTDNYEEINALMDVDSFIDYMAIEMYIINEDWPGHNTGLWRTRNVDSSNTYADGRWRWTLYDLEMGVDHYGNQSTKYYINNLEKMLDITDDPGVLFNALIKNSEFKQKFITVLMDLANVNFEALHTQEVMQPYITAYLPELPRFFERFQTWAGVGNATNGCIDKMNTFLNSRAGYIPEMLKETFALTGQPVEVIIETNTAAGGTIKLNTTSPDLEALIWKGVYLTDYPITLTAVAADGYTFAGWSNYIESSDSTITVSFSEAITLRAEFTKN